MQATVTLKKGTDTQTLSVEVGSLLSDIAALEQGHVQYLCAKKGICQKCLVQVTGALSPKTAREAALPQGQRLACCTRVLGDVTVTLQEHVTQLQSAERAMAAVRTADSCFQQGGIAVDIGTTTIAVSLVDAQNHIWTKSTKNPQLRFGADVVSRMEQSIAGQVNALAQAVQEGINALIDSLCQEAQINAEEIDGAVITGNTAMLHFLLQKDCTPISKAPFQAEFLAGEWGATTLGLHLNPAAKIFLPHCMGAFVGADIATALLASGMLEQDKTALLVDIGTNGEMALWHEGKLVACSTAAGPAFEGVGVRCGMHGTLGAIEHVAVVDGAARCKVIGDGKATGICGSGVIDAIAALLALELLDETGCLDDDDARVQDIGDDLYVALQDEVGIYGKDVRAIQLAKSAICAGINTLLQSCGIGYDQLDVLYLAGGFGSFIDVEKAGEIGLIPPALTAKVQVLGNAALTGAQILLFDGTAQAKTAQMQQKASLIDLASSAVFMEQYVENMFFE